MHKASIPATILGMSYRRTHLLGPMLILAFTLLPVALFVLGGGWISGSFSRNLGKIFALCGIVLLSLNFIISFRTPQIDRLFWGMNRAYIWHHLTGAFALVLLLFHPLLLSLIYLQSGASDTFAYLFPTPILENYATWFGIIALIVMLALLFLTFFANLAYELWLLTHKFLGVTLFFAFLHVWFQTSDTTDNLFLRFYLLGLVIIGLAAYVYRTLFGRNLLRRYQYRVSEVIQLPDDTISLTLTPQSDHFVFSPGQFVFLTFKSPSIPPEPHPFSLSSAPSEPALKVGAKMLGDFTRKFKDLPIGTSVSVEGPYGTFGLPRGTPVLQIWIAGGIGITPFISLARALPLHSPIPTYLFYSVKEQTEACYVTDLVSLHHQVPPFHPILYTTKTQGRLTAAIIQKLVPQAASAEIYICGPAPMMQSLRAQFVKIGVPNDLIHTEEFALQ